MRTAGESKVGKRTLQRGWIWSGPLHVGGAGLYVLGGFPVLYWLRKAMLAALLVLSAWVAREAVFLLLESQGFEPAAWQGDTPDKLGVSSTQWVMTSGDRQLMASWVSPSPIAPAVLIFHGDEENIGNWAAIQKMLYQHGIASMVFDYSGYGASSGRPTVAHLREDALTALQAFQNRAAGASKRYLLGFSLGTAVLADILPDVQGQVDGAVIASGFATAREEAVKASRAPSWIAPLMPDVWDSEAALSRVNLPVLLLHSRSDEVIDYQQGLRLYHALQGPKRMVALEGLPHDAPVLPAYSQAYWQPVIAWLGPFRSG